MRFDLLIKGAHLVDDDAKLTGRFDLAINGNRIAAVERSIADSTAFLVIDATNLFLTPGLIDMHVHAYRGATYWGVDADSIGARSGVTSWVDAGSPGALTLEGFRRFIVEPSKVRVSAFLNISNIGLTGTDYELANLDYCDVDLFEIVARRNRDILHGVKVRMGESTLRGNGLEPLRRGIEAAERCAWPVMVHIADGPPDIGAIADLLRPGDIITHCFTGKTMSILGPSGQPLQAIRRALDRGVLLDIGHGAGSFMFDVAEAALAAGLKPHAISSDIHQMSIAGPMYDMPTCLTKFLAMGMPLGEAVALATSAPARILGMTERGSLRPGSLADIALFSLIDGSFPLYDIGNGIRHGKQLLVNELTLVGGRILPQRQEPWRQGWIEEWANGGRDRPILEFQKELITRGHDPATMAKDRPTLDLTPQRGCSCDRP